MKYALRRLSSGTYENRRAPLLRHPVCACLGLRPASGQHTWAEHDALTRWATGRSQLVEIGVAEGVSAVALAQAMDRNGILYLIDPFHLSRFPALNFMKRTARRLVTRYAHGKVVWLEKFSHEAAVGWNQPLDFLLIDGDHAEPAVTRDWMQWSPFVISQGIVAFHDASLFAGGWTTPDYGPVKLVDRLFRTGRTAGWRIVEQVHSLVFVERGAQSAI